MQDYLKLIEQAEVAYADKFKEIDDICLFNQEKVLDAFIKCRVSSRHFMPSNGYGYGDDSRDKLCDLYAEIFNAEKALVSPHFASGTHTIACALFGILRPGDKVLALTGEPYDTLRGVINGVGVGSLAEFGITFDCVPLKNGDLDYATIDTKLNSSVYKALYFQRSPGYERRKGFTISQINQLIKHIRTISDSAFIVDNCYGEFVEKLEPTDVGADVIIGSLIKNPGGGLAPTGGYIAGKAELIDKIAMRLTAPGIGNEVGSYEHTYRNFYQGIFVAPHVVAEARKGGLLVAAVLEMLGYTVFPSAKEYSGDIVRVIVTFQHQF